MRFRSTQVESAVLRRLKLLKRLQEVQLSPEAYQYRDAVRFQNGREILLQRLGCGQQVEVLSLASSDIPEKRQRWMEELYSRMFVG